MVRYYKERKNELGLLRKPWERVLKNKGNIGQIARENRHCQKYSSFTRYRNY